jgi:DNA repair exonuclease SbcCD ATPase subunit
MKIDFEKIRYKNLLATGNYFIEIDLSAYARTLITGVNGVGKSTVWEALSIVAFNKPFRKVNRGQLINSINQKDLLIELEFRVLPANDHYLLRRGIKPSILELEKNGVKQEMPSDVREFQAEFEDKILKINHKSFEQIVVLGSNSFVPFMRLDAKDRRTVVEDLLDLQVFSVMNDLLKGRINANEDEQKLIDKEIEVTNNNIRGEESHLKKIQANHQEEITLKRKRIEERTAEVTRVHIQIEELQSNINKMMEVLLTCNKPLLEESERKLFSFETQFTRQLRDKNEIIKFFSSNDVCPQCTQNISSEMKNSIVSKNVESRDKIVAAQAELREKKKDVARKLNDIEVMERKIRELNTTKISFVSGTKPIVNEIEGLELDIVRLQNASQVSADEETLRNLQERLKTLKDHKQKNVDCKKLYSVAGAFLKDSGIKSQIIKRYVPVINKFINKYLEAMDCFIQFEFDENFEEKIKSRHRDDFTYESFSDGQKLRIDLALMFTWRSIAKMRNSMSINLLIMDEILDSSLDRYGVDNLLKLLMI